MKRGINLDIWTTWPGEEQWDRPEVILPYPEWRKTVGADELRLLKDAGFDFVRIPVEPSPFLSDRTLGLRDRLFTSVLESVRLVNSAGLKAIVDMHLIPAGDEALGMERVMNEPELFDAYVELVRKMARTLSKEDPALVAFEPMNEPGIECEADEVDLWRERQTRLFAAARASATQLTLILTGGCMSSAEGLATLDPGNIPDDNIIWTFHSYWPFLLTHQGATWAGDFIRYVTGLPYPLDSVPRAELDVALEKIREKIAAEAPWSRKSGMLAYLDEQVASMDTGEELSAIMDEPFDTVTNWAKEHGVSPENIFLGEFGMIRQE
ncbi:MAG: cellulase family glycosylhydrolase, partial [Pseudaminobacter sp.]|nr:cellulase family glycosylhydrolase [Pseudaminobacter sp.]